MNDPAGPGGESAPDNQGLRSNGDYFPRGRRLPQQSPLFWVAEKDRYLRQLLIRDIEELTGRRLLVYFADCESGDQGVQITSSDDAYLAELLGSSAPEPTDLLLETDGGSTDATEKLVALLRSCAPDLRVIVPRRAKSNGTLLALASAEVLMGITSELGPIDPILTVSPQMRFSAHLLVGDDVDPLLRRTAEDAIAQTKKLATTLLETGMLRGRPDAEISEIVDKLAGRDHFHSHGSVIDAEEATALGLRIKLLPLDDHLWQCIWLLRCMYAHDLRNQQLVKVFEGRKLSNALRANGRLEIEPVTKPV
ncbi:SDH family Clp fold serine proteinase [Allosphingosinicella deserti]|uniref:SDH family Clp fold serine proteinase n=1 Tax=Allosphingosinicella deserti TaxID=2116704 RepID=UPI0018EA34B1|nr:hypothetical protein [Sphingomonas deserti]